MKLYAHQQKIVDKDPKQYLLGHGTGTGKTITALSLARGKTLVVAPKMQKEDKTWEKNLKKINKHLDLTVISKERFRIDYPNVPHCDTLILEEVHTLLGVTPSVQYRNREQYPKTSQIFAKILNYIQTVQPERIYLVSATPAPQPMAVWGAAKFLRYNWDFFEFRNRFYFEYKRNVWMPRKNIELQDKLIRILHHFGDFVTLQDCFDVPEQTHKTIYVEYTPDQKRYIKNIKLEHPDPLVARTKAYGVDNGIYITAEIKNKGEKVQMLVKKTDQIKNNKIEEIKTLTDEFSKVLIFAQFIAQIDNIAQTLRAQGKKVIVLAGSTKDRANITEEAENATQCVFIAQSGISAGYELKTFRTVIFASYSPRYIDYIQGQGRVLRADALHKNLYISLVTKGGVDETSHKTIMSKNDFHLALVS